MKNIFRQSLAVFCLLNNSNPFNDSNSLVRADQPVHCLRENLFGVWNFHVSRDKGTVNLFETDEVCSHTIPNKVQLVNGNHLFQFENEDIYRLNILENYKVEGVFCPNGGKCATSEINGKWTSIYDQAFNIELDNGMRFIANFRYNIKPDVTKDPFKTAQSQGVGMFSQIQSGDYDKFDSQCNKTMVGFASNIPTKSGTQGSMTQHPVQCLHGIQAKHYDVEDTKAYNTGKVKFNKIVAHHLIQKENIDGETPEKIFNGSPEDAPKKSELIQKKRQKRKNLHLSHEPSDEMDLLIETVNESDLGWTADVCKYQKHHAKYGSHCDHQELLLAQIKDDDLQVDDDDSKKTAKKFDKSDPAFVKALEKAQKYMNSHAEAGQITDEELPEAIDFRNIDGYDFTSMFRDQGHCGSCYTISFTQVMEARMKLKYGKEAPMLSPQFLMTCNYMNEGCEGGWPHFNVFLAENGHLVTEECAPYQSATRGDKCSNYAKCDPVSKIKKSYLVGGGWGATSEKKMMKEILRNGPINGDFQAPSMFSLYKEGIFSEKGLIQAHKKAEEKKKAKAESLSSLDSLFDAQISSSNDETEEKHKKKDGVVEPKIKTGGKAKFSDISLNDKGISWMDMNHSVVIIGWGADDKTGTRYWIVRNSYGPKWGMDGDFLVKRGNNDFGMEVEQIAFEPVWLGQDE